MEDTIISKVGITRFQGAVIICLLLISIGIIPMLRFVRPVEKWEYMVEAVQDDVLETRMAIFGSSGWELVSAMRSTSGSKEGCYEMIFKRPKKMF
mgnify:CR=1 FL=1